MNAFKANLVNSISLILVGLAGYFLSETPSFTALIPVFAGILLLLLSKGIQKSSRVQAHVAVVLTVLIFFSLIMPLKGAINREHGAAIFRVIIMMATSVFAMIYFVKSFVDARRTRQGKI